MLDLSAVSGLPLWFDPQTCAFRLGGQTRDPLYGTRDLNALRPVLEDPDCSGPELVYWMYRNTGLRGDEHLLSKHRLRYDISIFVPCTLGREPMKTSGHYHPPVFQGGAAYPEIYEVLFGEALYLLQKVKDYQAGPDSVVVEDTIAMRVRAGQKAVMPPGYGHVTINTLDQPLVMSNWVCDDFSSYYQSVEKCRGFAYWLVEEKGGLDWIANPAYSGSLPPLRVAEPQPVPELGLREDLPMYQSCRENPHFFAGLTRPQDFEELLWRGLRLS